MKSFCGPRIMSKSASSMFLFRASAGFAAVLCELDVLCLPLKRFLNSLALVLFGQVQVSSDCFPCPIYQALSSQWKAVNSRNKNGTNRSAQPGNAQAMMQSRANAKLRPAAGLWWARSARRSPRCSLLRCPEGRDVRWASMLGPGVASLSRWPSNLFKVWQS